MKKIMYSAKQLTDNFNDTSVNNTHHEIIIPMKYKKDEYCIKSNAHLIEKQILGYLESVYGSNSQVALICNREFVRIVYNFLLSRLWCVQW